MAPDHSFYLGPRKARLVAASWDDIESAAAAGVLDETHWVELKEAIPASSKPANLELAKDLASLSVDGGVLIVGVKDSSGSAGAVVGTDLTGLQTRIAQVASGRISPPLNVTLDAFKAPGSTGRGVLVVSVAASESAPHMVDGNYWGRTDQGKRPLADEEVRRLLADRSYRATGFAERLHALPTQLDPVDLGDRGRLYIRLEPAAAAPEPMTELLASKHPVEVTMAALTFNPQWDPSLSSVNYRMPHPDGFAAMSWQPGDLRGHDYNKLAMLLADDGSVLVSTPAVRPFGTDAGAPECVSAGQILEAVHGAVQLAAYVAEQYLGFQGAWRAGVLITKLRGLLPAAAHKSDGSRRFVPFPADTYVETTDTTTQEMAQHTSDVVGRLTKRLLRGLNEDRFLPYTSPSELTARGR